jgi:hypothetical protein
VTVPQLSDERLAWLAVRDDLRNRSKSGSYLVIILRFLLLRPPPRDDPGQDATSKQMRRYAIVVDDLSRRLSKEDLATLRATGRVPEWFLPLVIKTEATIYLP